MVKGQSLVTLESDQEREDNTSMMNVIDKMRGRLYPIEFLQNFDPEKSGTIKSRDSGIKPANFYLNGLKARQTQKVEIPVILSRSV